MARRRQFLKIYSDVNQGDNNYTLRMANAIWAEKSHPFLRGYMQLAQGFYQTKVSNLDFVNDPENSRTLINQWVSEKTSDKINDLLAPGVIDNSTRLVITNAIYFKGTWENQFNPKNTKNANFTISPGNVVQVPMMQTSSMLNYTETDRLQVLELPYEHSGTNTISMMIILPKDKDLHSVENILDTSWLASLKNHFSATDVDVYVPKFSMDTEYDLSQTLGSMGMPTAFSGNADFSGMDGSRNLSIQQVAHKAFVKVDEEGTEAAAATTVVGVQIVSTEQHPIFRGDHPFLFIIQDQEDGNILFIGRVVNPT
jgi:serpin B